MMHGFDESHDEVVVELASFRVAPGVTETDVLNASHVIQHEFLRHQPGFLRRDLLRAGDGHWVDLVEWTDHDSFAAAMAVSSTSAACQSYFRLMADDGGAGTGMLHLRRVRRYQS
jgi:hypothetical protein